MKKNKFGFVASVLAVVLAFNCVDSNAVMAYAETTDNQSLCSVSDEEISPDRIAYAQVDTSCFTNLALDYVDKYVATDEDGNFYIIDHNALKEHLTSEQYSLVEDQIEAVNSDFALYAATGTESNPYELSDGVRSAVFASSEY